MHNMAAKLSLQSTEPMQLRSVGRWQAQTASAAMMQVSAEFSGPFKSVSQFASSLRAIAA
jgi:hypothetical protein